MVEFAILALIVVVWIADRADIRRRLEALERELQRERTADQSKASSSAATLHRDEPIQARPSPVIAPVSSRPVAHSSAAPSTALPPTALPPGDALPPVAPPLVRFLRDFFSGGNLIVRFGVLILLIGVGFLLRYAAEHSHLTIEDRLIGVAIGAAVMLGLGWRWRSSRRHYALALQGGGVGVLYLTVFFALRPYALLSPAAAFALLAAIGLLSVLLAILLDSMAFAILAVIGGFLAPVLAANGDGDHVTLFSYYALLDLVIVSIAWFRSWRALNLVAFLFTYGIGTAWGVLQYRPENYASTEPFLILFFLMFVCIALLFALSRAQTESYYVDGALVFGTPAATMALQAGMLHQIPYALAYSALTLSAIYLLLAWALHQRKLHPVRLLVESFIALSVAFATLAIPLALEARWTGAAWALEGAAALWIGLKQDRRLAVIAGILLQLAAGVAFFNHVELAPDPRASIAALMISVGGIVCATRMRQVPAWLAPWRQPIGGSLFIWGLGWWLFGASAEIVRDLAPDYRARASLALLAATAVLLSVLGAKLRWIAPRVAALFLFPLLAALTLIGTLAPHPFADMGWWIWPLALLGGYWSLKRDESIASDDLLMALHSLALWLVSAVAAIEVAWQTAHFVHGSRAWSEAADGLIPALVLWTVAAGSRGRRWPFAHQRAADAGLGVLGPGALGLGAYLLIWGGYVTVTSDGSALPLPYLPLLNPMDLSQGVAVLALVYAAGAAGRTHRMINLVVALAAFGWLNAILLRALHHYAGIGFDFESMAASTLAQTCLTIFWTLLALAAMVWANRAARRIAWIAGATLLGIVITKLFLIDLSRTGTVPRIVSFLGVGVLMLIIGYFSPLPPRAAETGH